MTQNEKTGYLTLKRAVYGQYSRSYDEDRDRFVSGSALAQRIDWALEPLRPGGRLLDLGCGSGQLLHRAVDHTGCEAMLTGFDLTPDMLALARAGLSGSVNLVEGDATAGRSFGDESFDLEFDELLRERFILGSPEECYEQLRPCWEEIGINHLVVRTHWAGMPLSTALHSMQLISNELLPELRKV